MTNLYSAIRSKRSLTEGEVNSLVYLLGKHCNGGTKRHLRESIKAMALPTRNAIMAIPNLAMQVKLHGTDAEFIKSVSYKDEVRALRQAFLK
jgi:hypothetical protein